MIYRLFLTLVLFAVCGGSLLAQDYITQDYDVQVSSGTYSDIDSYAGELIASGGFDSGYEIGVTFKCQLYSTAFDFWGDSGFVVARNGYIFINQGGLFCGISAYTCQLDARDSTSTIIEELDLEPSGAFTEKIQWNNMALVGNPPGDYVSFQLWLNDSDNSIEVHIGPNHVSGAAAFSPAPGPAVGMFLADRSVHTYYHSLYLTGNPLAPSRDSVTPVVGIGAPPPAGTIYRFTPRKPLAGVENPASANGIAFHPNPATGSTRLTFPEDLAHSGATLRIYDMLGREALVIDNVSDGATIAAGQLAPGLYYGVVNSGTHHYPTGVLIVR